MAGPESFSSHDADHVQWETLRTHDNARDSEYRNSVLNTRLDSINVRFEDTVVQSAGVSVGAVM